MRFSILSALGGPLLAAQALSIDGTIRPKLIPATDNTFQGRAKTLGVSSADNQKAESTATDNLQKTLKQVEHKPAAAKKEAAPVAAPIVTAEKKKEDASAKKVEEKKVETVEEKKTETPTGKKIEAETKVVAAAKEVKKEEKVEAKVEKKEEKPVEKPVEKKAEEKPVEKKAETKPVVVVHEDSSKVAKAQTTVSTKVKSVKTEVKVVEKKEEEKKEETKVPAAVVADLPASKDDPKEAVVSGMESKLGAADPGDWDMIKEFRAQKCSERPDPAHHDPCLKFMEPICNPGGADGMEGKKLQMNNEKGENGSGKGYCEAFYNNVNAQLCKEKGGEYCDGAEKKEEKKEEKKDDGGDKGGDGDKDKSSGGDDANSTETWAKDLAGDGMSGTQGTEGLYSAHKHADGDTSISGFGKEYGPKAGGTDYSEICKQERYKYNSWCDQYGDGDNYATAGRKRGASDENDNGSGGSGGAGKADGTYVDLWSALFWGVLLLVGTGLCLFVAFKGRGGA